MVSFSLLGLQHPEPNGSRRATPTSTFQHRPGHPPIYDSYNLRSFSTDNLLALFRALTYSKDEKFMAAFGRYAETYADNAKICRAHTYCWACRSAITVKAISSNAGYLKDCMPRRWPHI